MEVCPQPSIRRTQWLSKELNPANDQKANIKPILDEQTKQMKATREDNTQPKTQ